MEPETKVSVKNNPSQNPAPKAPRPPRHLGVFLVIVLVAAVVIGFLAYFNKPKPNENETKTPSAKAPLAQQTITPAATHRILTEKFREPLPDVLSESAVKKEDLPEYVTSFLARADIKTTKEPQFYKVKYTDGKNGYRMEFESSPEVPPDQYPTFFNFRIGNIFFKDDKQSKSGSTSTASALELKIAENTVYIFLNKDSAGADFKGEIYFR